MVKQVFFRRVPVEPGDRAQPAGDRCPRLAFGFQVTGEALDISAAGLEQADVGLVAPGGVLPQVQRAGLAGQARVASQEPGQRQPLVTGEHRPGDGDDTMPVTRMTTR